VYPLYIAKVYISIELITAGFDELICSCNNHIVTMIRKDYDSITYSHLTGGY